jgi:hypothetical protein
MRWGNTPANNCNGYVPSVTGLFESQYDLPYSDETEARLPVIAGGLSLAVARTFKVIDPKVKHPATEMWERAFAIFNLLL